MPPKARQWIEMYQNKEGLFIPTETITEQEVLKEFEEDYVITIIGYGYYFQAKVNEDIIIAIDTEEKTYKKYKEELMYPKIYTNVYHKVIPFTLKEHQLLHKLFAIWWWFDE